MPKNLSREPRNDLIAEPLFRPDAARKMRELEAENVKLKDTAIELALEIQTLRGGMSRLVASH